MAVIYEQCGVALEVRVDFGCEDATPIVRCKQGDKRRALRVYPRENGNEIITRDSGGTPILDPVQKYADHPVGSVTIRVQRPDGAVYSYSVPDSPWLEWEDTATGQGNERTLNYVEFALTEDMLAVAGRALCDVHFEYHQRIFTLSTASFYLDIEPKPTAKASGGVDPASFVNVKKIFATDYARITPDANTLYIIIDGETVSLAFGSAVLSSGGGYNETQVDNITDNVEEVTT